MKPYRAIFLDLFWTTVDLDFSCFPKLKLNKDLQEKEILSDAEILFHEVKKHDPSLDRDAFLQIFFRHRIKIREEWENGTTEEISCIKKFETFLKEFPNLKILEGIDLAQSLTQIHMQCIVKSTFMPKERKTVIAKLHKKHILALISNFDHAPSGHEILQLHGLTPYFHEIIISDEIGKRKPDAKIFQKALDSLRVDPKDTLMVGDTPLADIQGASLLGMETAWIKRQGIVWPSEIPLPDYTLEDITQLPRLPRVDIKD